MEEWDSLEIYETLRILNLRRPDTRTRIRHRPHSKVIVKKMPAKRTPDCPASDTPATTRKLCVIGACPICSCMLGENPLASTKCGHVFCKKCLEKCLLIEKKCPTCLEPLNEPHAYHILYMHFKTLTTKA